MNIKDDLSKRLLGQTFEVPENEQLELDYYKQLLEGYAVVESCIAVLSDLKADKSYVYYGALADALDLPSQVRLSEVDSIWEDKIFDCIHPNDLVNKHLMELQFFTMSNELDIAKRQTLCGINLLRMRNSVGIYFTVKHRIFYVSAPPTGSLRFAICLYNLSDMDRRSNGNNHFIFNTITGDRIALNKEKLSAMLSTREREILSCIKYGKTSKEIAEGLSISINTVNRHRQNILEKLNVKNSAAACTIGEQLGIL